MVDPNDDSSDGTIDRALRDLLDDEHHRQQVLDRRRRRQADEVVAFDEVLSALAAHGTPVELATAAGPQPTGTICEVGRDYLAIRADDGPVHLLPLRSIWSATSVSAATAPPAETVGLDLAERLRERRGCRAQLVLAAGSSALTGRIRRVGADVVAVELDDGADAFVALDAVTGVVVDP